MRRRRLEPTSETVQARPFQQESGPPGWSPWLSKIEAYRGQCPALARVHWLGEESAAAASRREAAEENRSQPHTVIMASAIWSLTKMDVDAVSSALDRLLRASGAHSAMIVDRSGQLVTVAGRPVSFDTTSFATLAAADFSANDQLARLIGEADFTSLAHEGENESLYFADIAHRLLLVLLFDKETTLAIIRMLAPAVAQELAAIFSAAASRDESTNAQGLGLLRGAEREIDSLFS